MLVLVGLLQSILDSEAAQFGGLCGLKPTAQF